MELLEECADMFIMCDDGTKIACSRFCVAKRCEILKWVTEDTLETVVPFPGVDSRVLRLALDVVHGVRELYDYDLEQLERAAEGFDILGCRIDVSVALWKLARTLDIDGLRARLPRLVRSKLVRDVAVQNAVQKAPLFEDAVNTVRACQPDPSVAEYLAELLARVYPVYGIVREILASCVPKPTLEQALRIVSHNGGVFTHPEEFAAICKLLDTEYSGTVTATATATFIESAAGALANFHTAPQTSIFGTSIVYDCGQGRASAFVVLDGKCPKRDVQVCKWLRVNFHDFHMSLRPRAVPGATKNANFVDVRVFVASGNECAEAWYSWTRAELGSMTTVVGTGSCPRVLGDVADLVDRGVAVMECTARVDVFFSRKSSAIDSGLPLFSSPVP